MQALLFPNIKRSSLLYRAIVLFCFLGLLNAQLVFSCPNDKTQKERIPPEIAKIADLSKEALGELAKLSESEPNPAIIVATIILSALGIFGDSDNMTCALIALHQHLDDVAQTLVWLDTEEARERRLADMHAAVKEVKNVIESDMQSVPRFSPVMRELFLAHALTQSDDVMQLLVPDEAPLASTPFLRHYSEYATDGELHWKTAIRDRPDHSNGVVFDWRFGVPELMQLIPLRLSILIMNDPTLSFPPYRSDLENYRHALQTLSKQMVVGQGLSDQMVGGIRCNAWPLILVGDSIFSHHDIDLDKVDFEVLCADINTGYALRDYFIHRKGLTTDMIFQQVDLLKERIYRAVLQKMPLFQMRAMIDLLFKMAHPEIEELAPQPQLINVRGAPQLCLDFPGNAVAPGTPGTLVQLADCSVVGKKWLYDRSTGNIYANVGLPPAYYLCLDVQWEDSTPGTPVWLWECNGTDGQKWTYDPETGVVQNALGTVLDIQWGVLQPGTPVWTWTRTESPAQLWSSYSPDVLTCTGCDRLLPPNRLSR